MWPIRSMLFVPAHRPELVAKAIRSRPGAVVLDIEDSVPPPLKPAAMAALAGEIGELQQAGLGAVVRINPLSDATSDELAAAVHPGLTAIMLPKAQFAAGIARLADLLSYHEGRAGVTHGTVGILPLPETAEGMHGAVELARASERVRGIHGAISGPVAADFARAFGFRATMEGTEQLYLASKLVLDSRAGGAAHPMCGVFGMPADDLASVERLIQRARAFGYAGVTVMHPRHVPIANAAYRPTEAEIAEAESLLQAFEDAERKGLGAVSHRGAMIDYAMLPHAREILAERDRWAALERR